MTQVWALDLPSSEKFVLLALADNANDEGECWPSIQTIARKTNLSERTVQRAIIDLEERRLVHTSPRYGRSTKYFITPAMVSPRQGVTPESVSPHPRQGVTPPPSPCRGGGDMVSPITINEPSIEPSRNPHRAGEDQIRLAIKAIKAKYPPAPHADWITAEKTIRRLVSEGSTWAEIEDGVGRYAAYCKATDRRVRNPATFFDDVSRPWLSRWALPKSKADKRLDSNIDVLQQFIAGGS